MLCADSMPELNPNDVAGPSVLARPSWLLRLLVRRRRIIVVAMHLVLIALSNYLAFLLRFDFDVPDAKLALWLQTLPWLIAIRGLTFVPFRLYEGLWRYTGIWDLLAILGGVGSSSAIFFAAVRWGAGLVEYPRVVYITDAIVLVFFMGGIRLLRRAHRELRHIDGGKRVLIFGAGDAGALIVRDMRN